MRKNICSAISVPSAELQKTVSISEVLNFAIKYYGFDELSKVLKLILL